jgi:hypothetical protein
MLRCPSCGCPRVLVRISDVVRDYRCLECHEAWKPDQASQAVTSPPDLTSQLSSLPEAAAGGGRQ